MFLYNRAVSMKQDRPVSIWFQNHQFLIGKDGFVLEPLSEKQVAVLKKNPAVFVEIVSTETVIEKSVEEVPLLLEEQPVVVETTKSEEEPVSLNDVEVPVVKKNKGGRPPKKKKESGSV